MTAQDKQRLAMLKARGKKLHDDFTSGGRANFEQYLLVPIDRPWWDTSGPIGGDYEQQLVPSTVTTQSAYESARQSMVNDVATFEAAVARADEDGEIYYVAGQGFTTFTAADQKRADRATMVAAGIFFATDVVPSWFAPTRLEPVADLRGGGYRAPIPISTLEDSGLKRPHGNIKDSGEPAQGYTLRSRRTGAILKYGETTRGEQRYSKAYLRQIDAYMQVEVSGTKAEMHAWQHQKIVEYKTLNGGQRPPLNKSDF